MLGRYEIYRVNGKSESSTHYILCEQGSEWLRETKLVLVWRGRRKSMQKASENQVRVEREMSRVMEM